MNDPDYGLSFETILVEQDGGVLTVTINRPEVLNAFNQVMCEEFRDLWTMLRDDDSVRAVVLRAAGDRAFSTGVDRKSGITHSTNPFHHTDPGPLLGPKSNECFKPIVCAINGMCAGGAFYWVNEADIVICSENATFFDPHATYGMTSALEPIGLSRRIPYGEVMRWVLMGLDERMSAQRALTIGLVSEVVANEELHARADYLAKKVAAKPGVSTEGAVKAVWQGQEVSLRQAQTFGAMYPAIGNPLGKSEVESSFESGVRPEWELR
jgi:enoyl-CoA hydratase/carnithine racemase